MFLEWVICWIFLILCTSTCGLEIFKDGRPAVTCSQGLSDCTMKDTMPPTVANNEAFDIVNLEPDFKLCCKDRGPCTLCMAVDIEIKLNRDEEIATEQLKDSEDTSNPKAAAVTVCYFCANVIPACKQVEFTGNVTQQEAKISIVVTEPNGVTFGSTVLVYSSENPHVRRKVLVPSIDEACSPQLSGRLKECDVSNVSAVINMGTNQVELRPADGAKRLPSVCVQHESNGQCKKWNRMNISLHSVTPCTCFQIWNYTDTDNRKGQRRSRICPFKSTDFLMRNVWENMSVEAQLMDGRSVLKWTLSAPCRLDGEVWPCWPQRGCSELQGFRRHLRNSTWTQNRRSRWETTDVFEDRSLQLPACLMVKVRRRDFLLGPHCNTGRWRWIPLIFGVTLLLCLTLLVSYLTRNFVKKWVWRWHHGRFVKIGKKGPVLLLSPPDVDDDLSKALCDLCSLLHHQDFSVTLDSCCRKEQCDLGPIPWLHSQMMKLDGQDGRAVLVLTHEALERALEWDLQDKMKEEEREHPHSAIFKSSLFLIHTYKQQERARERFVLVTFDSNLCRKSRPPGLLLGLRLFQLPSQSKALLTELAVGGSTRQHTRPHTEHV